MVFEEFADFKYTDNEDEFVTEFVVTYSKYLITADFDLVKDKIADLARRGHTRSLAKYLDKVEPENWDEDLKQKGYAIKNRIGAKTPQEWEVVASIDWHEPVCYDDITSIKDLRDKICLAGEDYYYADQFHKAGQISDDILGQKALYCRLLLSAYEMQPYMQAVKKVQEGYYSAFMKDKKWLDAVGYLEFTLDPDDYFLDENKLKEYGNKVLSKNDVADLMVKEFDSLKMRDDVRYDLFYGYGVAKTLYGKNEKEQKHGVKALNIASKMPIEDILKPIKMRKEKPEKIKE